MDMRQKKVGQAQYKVSSDLYKKILPAEAALVQKIL